MDEFPLPSFPSGRRLGIAIHVAVAAALLLAILLMVNYLAARHPVRKDLTSGDRFILSPLTIQVLQSLTNQVRITALFDSEVALFSHVDSMLQGYRGVSSKITLDVVDYSLAPGRAIQIRDRYNLGRDDKDLVIFESGKETRFVRNSELSIYDADINSMLQGGSREVRRSAFKGEALFTSAIVTVSQAIRPKVCYLQGHGEHDPRSSDQNGYRKFIDLLAERNVTVELLTLGAQAEALPSDCELLVIAGANSLLEANTLQKVGSFLDQGGRLLVLLNVESLAITTGLEEFLTRWGIAVRPSVVSDTQQTTGGSDVLVGEFGSHPVVYPLAHGHHKVQLLLPRTVAKIPEKFMPADPPKVEYLLFTSDAGQTKSRIRDGTAYYDSRIDIQGQRIPMAAAAEKGGLAGVADNRGATRLVVVGDSFCFGNQLIDSASNRDFASLAVNWLLDRQRFLAIGPKPIHEYTLRLTPAQLTTMRWLFLAVLPGSILLLGFVVWLRRRA